MGKTIVPIKSKGYKLVHGSLAKESTSSGAHSRVVIFDSKVVAIFWRVLQAGSYPISCYAVNPSSKFFEGYDNMFDSSYPQSSPSSYRSEKTIYTKATIVDNQVTFYLSGYDGSYEYTAILEDNLEDDTRSIFLLNGTTLLTDGTPTTDVADAIQTVDTNKYKIKSNALVNISNATYINLSN